MSNSTLEHQERSWELLRSLAALLALRTTVRDLRESGTSATLTRLFESKHVRDLKLIAGGASWIMLVGVLVILAVFIHGVLQPATPPVAAPSLPTPAAPIPHIWQSIEDSLKTIVAIIAIGGAVIAWVYRTASVRLGVVDLFSSEIITLCRVGTIVDMAQHSVATFGYGTHQNQGKTSAGQSYAPHRFTSEENYFPVFSGNAKDLEVLEANVVINVTAFYIMKVVRDYLRRAGDLQPTERHVSEWRETWKNIIYMQFLAYETARNAINDLVEYEPTHAENTITILLTEVVAYQFLLDNCKGDFFYGRLLLRFREYQKVAEDLQNKVLGHLSDQDWDKAIELWNELAERLSKLDIVVVKLPDKPSGTKGGSREPLLIGERPHTDTTGGVAARLRMKASVSE